METQIKQAKQKVDNAFGSGTTDKVEGQVKSAFGSAKATVGKWIGDEELRAEGHREHAQGEVQHAKGELKGLADQVVEKAQDAREKAGVIFDEARAKAKALADEAKEKLAGAADEVGKSLRK